MSSAGDQVSTENSTGDRAEGTGHGGAADPAVDTGVDPAVDPAAEPAAEPGVEPGVGTELPPAFADPAYAEAVVDLLGALAYGELTAFDRLAEDSTTAPTTADKAALAAMACAEFGHFSQLRDRLEQLGADPYDAMAPFRDTFDRFHTNTKPKNWLESLIKAYVGDGLAGDFYREVAAYLDEQTRALILDVLDDSGHSAFAVDRVRTAIAEDPRVGGRLALWGRRLVGEAITQAQSVATERDALAALLAGGVDRPGMDLAAIGRMFARLTENHAKRMAALGLSS